MCCVQPNHAPNFMIIPTLEEWLEELKLSDFIQNFIDAGYDDVEQMMGLMRSEYQLDDITIKDELGIGQIGYR